MHLQAAFLQIAIIIIIKCFSVPPEVIQWTLIQWALLEYKIKIGKLSIKRNYAARVYEKEIVTQRIASILVPPQATPQC